jgi:hypothetical protein
MSRRRWVVLLNTPIFIPGSPGFWRYRKQGEFAAEVRRDFWHEHQTAREIVSYEVVAP